MGMGSPEPGVLAWADGFDTVSHSVAQVARMCNRRSLCPIFLMLQWQLVTSLSREDEGPCAGSQAFGKSWAEGLPGRAATLL